MKQYLGFGFIIILIVCGTISSGCISQSSAQASGPVPSAETSTAPTPSITTTMTPPATEPVSDVGIAPVSNEQDALTHYINSNYRFSIDYPTGWEVTEFTPYHEGVATEFISPPITRCNTLKTECSDLNARLSIYVDPSPTPSVIEDYYIKNVAKMEHIEITKKMAYCEIMDKRAYRMDYIQNDDKGSREYKAMKVFAKIGNTVYIFTYQAPWPKNEESGLYDEYLDQIEDAVESFKV
jgi:hypothetical protein